MLQPSELKPVMAHAGAFVLASTFDPWPVVVLEAAASSLPILVSSACGSGVELVVEGVNGLRFDPLDVEQAARHMADISSDARAAEQMGAMSRQIAWGFDTNVWTRALERWVASTERGVLES
jgi:glycosyltransferase involved in cell wall biosynthesis